MPRIRSIKPDYWKSEKLATRLPGPDGREARRLFIGLWNFAEDHGVVRGSAVYLRAELYPYDDDVSVFDVERWVGMLVRGGFVVRYQREGSTYLWVRGWRSHQKISKPSAPTLPAPTEEEMQEPSATIPSPLPESSRSPPEPLQVGSGSGSGSGSGGGREVEGEEPEPLPHPPPAALTGLRVEAVAAGAEPEKRAVPRVERPPGELQDRIRGAYKRRFGVEYPWRERADGDAVRELLRIASGDDDVIVGHWERSIAHRGFPKVRSLIELVKFWTHFDQAEGGGPPAPGAEPPREPGYVEGAFS